MDNTIIVKVSSTSNPASVAGAIAGFINEYKNVEVQAIGAGAVNVAVKALITARGFLVVRGKDLSFVPAFANVEIDGVSVSAIKFIVRV